MERPAYLIMKEGIAHILLLSLIVFSFNSVIPDMPIISVYDSRVQIKDLTYYLIMAKELWINNNASIYRPETHFSVLSAYAGQNIQSAMPLGIPPVGLLLLLPFVGLMQIQLKYAFVAWASLSTYLFFSATRKIFFDKDLAKTDKTPYLQIGLFSLLFFTPFTLEILSLGQSSIIATSLLILLWIESKKDNSKSGVHVYLSILLIFLSFKIPYILIGTVILASYQRWKEIALAYIFLGILTISTILLHDTSWIVDYYTALKAFSSSDIPDYYQDAFTFRQRTMSLNSPLANRAILIVNIFAIFSFILFFNYNYLFGTIKKEIKRYQIISGITGIYLLLSPYLGIYENFLLIALLAGRILIKEEERTSSYSDNILIGITWLFISAIMFLIGSSSVTFWGLKATILIMLFFKGNGLGCKDLTKKFL